MESQITVQRAAELLNAALPYVMELVDRGDIAHRNVGLAVGCVSALVLAFKEFDAARRRTAQMR